MTFRHTLLAAAVLSTFSSFACADDAVDASTPKVVVTASPFKSADSDQILNPAKVLAGDALRDKVGSSLGETLASELGVSASAFGAGASRPIIRGMEGARVMMLENGMATSDVSGLSNDHAVSARRPPRNCIRAVLTMPLRRSISVTRTSTSSRRKTSN